MRRKSRSLATTKNRVTPLRFLVTGSTGFVGSHFTAWCLRRGIDVVALVRGDDVREAERRVEAAVRASDASHGEATLLRWRPGALRVALWELTGSAEGPASPAPEDAAMQGCDGVWHFAASLSFDIRWRDAIHAANVLGTRRCIDLALRTGARRFIYISTAYTAGAEAGVFAEELHSPSRRFNNYYEESKCLAEHEVARRCGEAGLDFSILRPSIVVGPSTTLLPGGSDSGLYGFVREVATLAPALRARGRGVTILGDPEAPLNLIPIDHLLDDIATLIDGDFAGGPIYHLTSDSWVSVGETTRIVGEVLGAGRVEVARGRDHERSALERVLDAKTEFYRQYLDRGKRFLRSLGPGRGVDAAALRGYVEGFIAPTERPPVAAAVASRRAVDLRELVLDVGRRHADRVFLEPAEPGVPPLDFAALARLCASVDRLLDAHGAPRGERVMVVLPSGSLLALLFLAVIAAGRVLVPVNPTTGARELAYMLTQTRPALVIASTEAATLLDAAGCASQRLCVGDDGALIRELAAGGAGTTLSALPSGGATMAQIMYTSGSTGVPKGVVHSHANLLSDAYAVADHLGVAVGDRFMTVCPLFHNSGQVLTTLIPAAFGGTTTAIRPELALLKFWQYAKRHRADWTLVMPTFLVRLLQAAAPEERASLKGIVFGGAGTGKTTIEAFERRFGVPLIQCYGLTETTSITTLEPLDRGARVVGSAGRTLPLAQLEVVQDGRAVAPGERGEIRIRGANVSAGYFEQPELSAGRFRDGWLYTGDIGHVDADGNVFVVERIDSMVSIGGEKVYPAEIERLLPDLVGMAEGAVLPLDEPVMGTTLVLVFRCAPGFTADVAGWRRALRTAVSAFKVPARFVPLDVLGLAEFPRAENGKLLRKALSQRLYDHRELALAIGGRHGE